MSDRRKEMAGFSLMEILVALSLVGLILTLSARSSMGMYERWQQSIELRTIKGEFIAIRNRTFVEKRDAVLSEELERSTKFPEGWTIKIEEDPLFNRFGQCRSGSVLAVSPSGREFSLNFAPPRCNPVKVE